VNQTWLGDVSLWIADLEMLKVVLKDIKTYPKAEIPNINKGRMGRFFGSQSLVNANNADWKHQRNVLTPLFIRSEIFFLCQY